MTGERQLPHAALTNSGFVYANDLSPLDCAAGYHKIRVLGDAGVWAVWYAFFGGRIGATVSFPGPNLERWRTADVGIPIGKRNWEILESPLLKPIRVHVTWKELEKVMPSIPMVNTGSAETVTR